jgi:hypothetical protein
MHGLRAYGSATREHAPRTQVAYQSAKELTQLTTGFRQTPGVLTLDSDTAASVKPSNRQDHIIAESARGGLQICTYLE